MLELRLSLRVKVTNLREGCGPEVEFGEHLAQLILHDMGVSTGVNTRVSGYKGQ